MAFSGQQALGENFDTYPDKRYAFLNNAHLPIDFITKDRAHIICVIVGASTLVIGFLLVTVRLAYKYSSLWLPRLLATGPRKSSHKNALQKGGRKFGRRTKRSAIPDLTQGFGKVKTFSFHPSMHQYESLSQDLKEGGRMQIVSISGDTVKRELLNRAPVSGTNTTRSATPSLRPSTPSKEAPSMDMSNLLLGSIDLARLSVDDLDSRHSDMSIRANMMNEFRIEQGLHGLILCHQKGDSLSATDKILNQFRQQLVPIVLQADADSDIWDTLDYNLVDGIVVENACIQRNGERRDFFRASKVRDCAAQCKEHRKNRAGFFFGFIEIYEVVPTAAVLRRAYKLADFFGAVLETKDALASPNHNTAIPEMPLSAFDSLKNIDVIWLQKVWNECTSFQFEPSPISPISPGEGTFDLDLSQVADVIPDVHLMLQQYQVRRPGPNFSRSTALLHAPDYVSGAPERKSIWDFASCGTRLAEGGCFALREEITEEQYSLLLRMQRSLKERRMLQLYGDPEYLRITTALKELLPVTSYPEYLEDLLEGIAKEQIKVLAGLDSGFSLPDAGGQMWGLMDAFREAEGRLDIHISLKSASDTATIWHVYLAHRGVTRLARFEEEKKLRREVGSPLPLSIAKELETSAESELLYLVQQIQLSVFQHPFQDAIVTGAHQILLTDTTRRAWISLHSKSCLDRSVSIRSLLEHRLAYFKDMGAQQLPSIDGLCAFFKQLEIELERALLYCDRAAMDKMSSGLATAYGHAGDQYSVTPLTDLYGLLYFCALRRLAFENVYIETTDRCPFFLSQPDQAAVFSELWVLGSQCEIYFGVMPRTLGEITYNRYRKYLMNNPPPVDSWDGKEVFTAYCTPPPRVKSIVSLLSKVPDQSEEDKLENPRGPPKPAKYRAALKQLGAFSIFCVPAIVDVCLLCFLGRGLYLSYAMPRFIRLMSDYAILSALVLTGGITGWVGSSGGFYLYNHAFDNMVHFLIHRFSGSLMLTTGVAFCGFIAFGAQAQFGWLGALAFVLYLYPLSIFLTLLGVFATMHRADAPLPSGRTAMWKCLPILLISPILTIFVHGYDPYIYLIVVYTFTLALVWEFRKLCHAWTDWHLKVPSPLKENDLLKWFKDQSSAAAKDLDSIALAAAARSALLDVMYTEARRRASWFKRGPKADPFVTKIVDGLSESMFLLKKECAGTEMPEMFTTTWFVQLELALNNQRQLSRGLREHSAFINYRYSRYDIGQNVGLFLAALLDRIVQLVMTARSDPPGGPGGPKEEGNLDEKNLGRYAICFALLHFLFGALSVDLVLQRYWAYASMVSSKRLGGVADLHKVLNNEEKQRQKRYWRALSEVSALLLTSFGVFTILVWLFVADSKQIIHFYTYVSSYTAVLLCQFHRCFTKSHRMHVMTVFCCCLVGFIVGIVLRALPYTASFPWTYVIAQNTACISAMVGTAFWIFYNPNTHAKKLDAASNEFKGSPPVDFRSTTHRGAGCAEIHHVNKAILDHICLGIDVNIAWANLHEDVRKLILGRLLGQSAALSAAAKEWADLHRISVQHHDEDLRQALTEYDKRYSELQLPSGPEPGTELTSQYVRHSPKKNFLVRLSVALADGLENFAKWTAIITGGTPDTPRELWYSLRESRTRVVTLWILLKIWKVCWWSRVFFVHFLAISGKPTLGSLLDLIYNGARRTLRRNIITVNTPTWKITGFVIRSPLKQLGVIMYDGLHTKAPESKRPIAVAFYDDEQRLRRRQDIRGPNDKPVETNYIYLEKSPTRWPLSKTTIDGTKTFSTNYDSWGRPVSGELVRGEARFDYQYFYKRGSSYDSEVLHATYQRMDGASKFTISVFWCVRPRTVGDNVADWIASDKVQSVLAVIDGQTYEIRWLYKHAQGADVEANIIDKRGKRRPCLPPAEIMDNKLNFLTKPKDVSFDHEDLLIYHPLGSLQSMVRHEPGVLSKIYHGITSVPPFRWFRLGEKVVFHKLPTGTLRTALWTAWGKAPFVDAVTASCLDEMILRKEPLLKKYWRLRDAGHLTRAAFVLDENLEQIISAMEPTHESSDKCSLLIKSADLFIMGLGKDATQLTARLEDAYRDTDKTTSVIFSDNGCWPDNPGGVSNCRRDLVNGHTTIRGHCLAESANDFGIPRYQIERNINTLKVLPLWGLDGKTAHHGLFDNLLQTQVDNKITATKLDEDIRQVFVPLLRAFILGARSKKYTRHDLVEYSNVLLKMNRYFETCDYNKTWNSELVWRAWIEGWLLEYNDPNVRSPSECFALEQPSLSDFRDALNLYICYFFIYSVQMPEDCPKVFQSTHHGISSLFGMLLKYRRGTTWGLWDHAILWRETCLNISPAQCLLPLPVQSMLLAGVKLACHLAYTHVDIVLPCTSVFNPDWEADLGTDSGQRGSKKLFYRKIDPIVNGIGNMDSFKPVQEVRSKLPTTVMLSNVQFIKDVKTAVLAADVIINKYGFTDYRLIIYGAQDRQPSYALETVNLINSRGLAGKVILGGFGSPKEVLKDAWLFVNSSLSEGLPLAIGEAALSGVPIVATEVGATSLVLTDPDNSAKRYGEVVPPNDPESLARAQLSILTMSGQWAKYTKAAEPCKLPDVFDVGLVKKFMDRMHAFTEDRRNLGLKLRDVVLRSFHGNRYLREHEQMYWIQRRQAEIRRSPMHVERHPPINEIYGEKRTFMYDKTTDMIPDAKRRWQLFDMDKYSSKVKRPVRVVRDSVIPHPMVVELGEK